MFYRKRNRTRFLKVSFSIILLFLFTISSWKGIIKPNDSIKFSKHLTSNSSLVLYINSPQVPIISSWTPLLKSFEFKLAASIYNELIINRLSVQRIEVFKKIEFAISYNKPPGFYLFFAKRETDDYPVLS
jgi:hypothetical protein